MEGWEEEKRKQEKRGATQNKRESVRARERGLKKGL